MPQELFLFLLIKAFTEELFIAKILKLEETAVSNKFLVFLLPMLCFSLD